MATVQEKVQKCERILAAMTLYQKAIAWQKIVRQLKALPRQTSSHLDGGCQLIKPAQWHQKHRDKAEYDKRRRAR